MRRAVRFVPVICVLTLTTACGSRESLTTPTENPQLGHGPDTGGRPGVYVLQSVAADRLPATVIDNGLVKASMIADTFFLHADGTGAVASLEQVTESRPVTTYMLRAESPLIYEIAADRLTAEIPCRDVIIFAACVKPPHYRGAFSDGALDLDYALESRVPMHYVRVAGPTNIKSVEISPSASLTIKAGASLQLAARVLDAQRNAIGGKRLSWTSLISSAATVTPAGLVRGVAEGNTLITAFVEGRADTVTVRVTR